MCTHCVFLFSHEQSAKVGLVEMLELKRELVISACTEINNLSDKVLMLSITPITSNLYGISIVYLQVCRGETGAISVSHSLLLTEKHSILVQLI